MSCGQAEQPVGFPPLSLPAVEPLAFFAQQCPTPRSAPSDYHCRVAREQLKPNSLNSRPLRRGLDPTDKEDLRQTVTELRRLREKWQELTQELRLSRGLPDKSFVDPSLYSED
jgi:hypothetical protein